MLGNKSVGIYSVALRISEIWYFIPMTVVASTFPSIIESKRISEEAYLNKFKKLFKFLFWTALFLSVCTSFFAKFAINLLYGDKYIESASILVLQTWSGIFVFLGVAGGRWFLAENLQNVLIYRTISGAIINIGLNIILIPKYGTHGAAWATLISQAVANIFSNAIGKKSRPLFYMQVESIFGFLKPQKL
jgi:O-antigen/teichoic acid export membrane protein